MICSNLLLMADNITDKPTSISTERSNHPRWDFLKRFKKIRERSPQVIKETPAELKAARAKIIDSVLSQGLLASSTVNDQGGEFFGSIDNKPIPNVMGRTLKPKEDYRDQADFESALAQALYWGDNSCLPVVVERAGEGSEERHLFRSTQAEKDRISERVFASFLVITNSEGEPRFDKSEDQTRPQDFIAILFPDQVLRDYDPDLTKTGNQNVKSVTGTVSRGLEMGDPIPVPDYESGIKKVLEETKTPIWIHAVRLPVAHDLAQAPLKATTPQASPLS